LWKGDTVIAMELGQREMVDLLLDSGADIGLQQPVWRFHECSAVPRALHLRVTAGLRAAAAAAGARKESKEGNHLGS
jgi:hypothetical protein